MEELMKLIEDLFYKKDRVWKDRTFEQPSNNETFVVHGWVYHQESRSKLQFRREFMNYDEASQYFALMKQGYPISIIKLYRETWEEMRVYA